MVVITIDTSERSVKRKSKPKSKKKRRVHKYDGGYGSLGRRMLSG